MTQDLGVTHLYSCITHLNEIMVKKTKTNTIEKVNRTKSALCRRVHK